MVKRQDKKDAARRAALIEAIGITVVAIMDGSTPELEKKLTELRLEDDKHDGMAYDTAMQMINRSRGFEQTGSGTYKLW